MKKRNFLTICTIGLFVLLIDFRPSQAATITAGTISAAAGTQDVQVPVDLICDPDEAVSAIQISVGYDAGQLDFLDSEIEVAEKSVDYYEPVDGDIRFVVYGINDNDMCENTIIYLNFDIPMGASAGETSLSLSNCVAADPQADQVTLNTTDGRITITNAGGSGSSDESGGGGGTCFINTLLIN